MSTENTHLMFVRPRPGIVGEHGRVMHVIPLSEETMPAEANLTSYCGTQLAITDIDSLERPAGMPCVMCLSEALWPCPRCLLPGY